ncbi:MAG TPA: LuxR C-terminal-related transcriptional regulator [Terriglobales bacterium]|jgi:DNA-binding CsgD family transcriptional regulator|nr:LuxR C-terminal-related transcriptional regulator [Terriglobales bacterium]
MGSNMPQVVLDAAGEPRTHDVLAPAAAGFVLLNAELEPISSNAEALRILDYPGGTRGRRAHSLLADKIVSSLITRRSPPDFVPEFTSGRRLYACRTFFLSPSAANRSSAPAVALLLERKSPGWLSLSEISDTYNLTRRERQTVELLVRGLTTKEIAVQMSVSPNTVKAFLRLVMIKLGVSTRSGIVGKIISMRLRQ